MNVKKVIAGALLPLTLLALPGCSMLPEEEEFRSAPVLRDYQQAEYTLTPVLRGDLELTQSISCRYEPVKEEKLSFGVGGLYFAGIYVERGDYVTKGTLLAELQMGSLKDDIENCESEIARLEMRLRQANEMTALTLNRHKLYLQTLSDEARTNAQTLEEKRAELDLNIQAISDSLVIQQMRREELEQKRAERQLVAGMDGTVMYLRSYRDGDTSTENSTFITLSDTESSMFTAETEFFDILPVGEEFTVVCSKVEYPVRVVSAEELGLPAPDADAKKQTVYLKLLEPAVDLESGDRGTVSVLLDSRQGALYVNSKAVSTVDGRSFVYVLGDDGLRHMVDVEIGLSTGSQTEIVSGLNEGDEIILA